MSVHTDPPWLRWLPPESRAGVLRRGLIVWCVAAFIPLMERLLIPVSHPLVEGFVYSYAISTATWFLADPMRIALWRWLRLEAPHYWSLNMRSLAYLLGVAILGYGIGVSIGDAYAGRSTWDMLHGAPGRFWAVLLWSLGISAGFLFYFYHREQAHELQRLATETRLKLLESQLEPHMLFNTLANLRALIATDPTRATEMLDRLGDFLRATLAASRNDARGQSLKAEFDRLRDYLELMAMRLGPRIRYTLDLPGELSDHPIPPLLLQPLVENAIKHGLEPSISGGDIHVSASKGVSTLRITVKDTGVGMDTATPPGFGLMQVRERLDTTYGPQGQMECTTPLEGGTCISLILPLQA